MLNDTKTFELIQRVRAGDREAKEILLKENENLLKSIVKRYLGKGTDYNDLFQLAGMGFLKALDAFDESYGAKLTTYAVPVIAGEIKRFLRDDGSVKVSRSIKEKSRELHAFISEQTAKNGSEPTLAELSSFFQMEENDILFILDSARMPLSLYQHGDYKDDETGELIEKLPSKDFQDEWIEKMELKRVLDTLPDREKRIILLRYYRDMTQSEVAKEIGVSQVQISRIETKVLQKFKDELQ